MKNYYLFILYSFCFICKINAQENYSSLSQKALETMWEAKDDIGYKKALDIYEEAFKIFPDSIDGTGRYKASVLAAELKDNDKAFHYLIPLVEMKVDEEGYPCWIFVVGKNSENEYKNLLSDPRWNTLKQKALKDKSEFYKDLEEKEKEFYSRNGKKLNAIKNPKTLYKEIQKFNPYVEKNNRDYSIFFKINDSIKTSFLVHLPKKYNPNKKYPVLFFLHGAVNYASFETYQIPQEVLGGWNRYYTKYAEKNEVILVFPSSDKNYNWMLDNEGFSMIPEIVKRIKKAINIDDDKIFISGHSNGATGSFSYLMKQPTQFAGFYGFNTYPKVFKAGTFIENSKNRSFINFSTDKDYYYPPNANDDFTKLMQKNNLDYKEYRYNGFPHWFPEFDESEAAYEILFNDLNNRKRTPFPKEISWEMDNDKYGDIDWLSDIKLDTLGIKAVWHKELNFKIDKWLIYDDNDSLIIEEVNKNAFDFPRKSGKINAKYNNNSFRIEVSNIKSFRVNISPEMINIKKKIKVYINDKLYFNEKLKYNRDFMLYNFDNNYDKKQIWINSIQFKL